VGSLWRKLGEGYFLLGAWLFGESLGGLVADADDAEPTRLLVLTADDDDAIEFAARLAAGLQGEAWE
jgi:hypothetical protein